MAHGIAPTVLLAQVQNTAAWALEDPDRLPGSGPRTWREWLARAPDLRHDTDEPAARHEYLALLLAAHYVTVATFVPTDVDTRIRHHAWWEITDREALREAAELVCLAESWDARAVSDRVVEAPVEGPVSGHDGEWLGVRAGALGRALALRMTDLADELAARIDQELAREAAAFDAARRAPGRELDALRLSTVLAHNAGDLSRVVEDWPCRSPEARAVAARFVRLGHEDPSRYGGAFHLAGHVNKAVMAVENHRFLPLREARSLRRARALLLPIGPFFDAWGERVGAHRGLDDDDRAEVLAALLEGHAQDPTQQGYLRAIAGLHRRQQGGIDALARAVPARLRKLLAGGAVRDALRVDPARFEARVLNRYRAALASYR